MTSKTIVEANANNTPFLTRLLKSRRANVLPIVAAGLVPMTAMIGGAVDMSRVYMVKSRIQQACDAAVLAGRRSMDQGTYDDEDRAVADDFFNINFTTGYQNTTDLDFDTDQPNGTSRVEGHASVVVPTVIMGMFGREQIPVSVDCEAELNVANSDVTFVLDTTGSMNTNISDGKGGTTTRIQGLRDAVMSFYDVLADASNASGARVRYAFVPYTVTTNVGGLLYAANPEWLVGGVNGDAWTYQSRRPVWNVKTPLPDEYVYQYVKSDGSVVNTTAPNSSAVQSAGGGVSVNNCQKKFGLNKGFNGNSINFNPSPAGNYNVGNVTYSFVAYSHDNKTDFSGSGNKTCVRQRLAERNVESYNYSEGATFVRYDYAQYSFPTYDLVRSLDPANPAVILPSEQTTTTNRWDGCIEERTTVAGSTFTVAGGQIVVDDGSQAALDLNIDGLPSNDINSKWRPYWEKVYFRRNNASKSSSCPAAATLLAVRGRNNVQNYVNGLVPGGNTYHDIGLIWGARVSSPQGLFQANVTEAPNNSGVVGRHVIFMTDGELNTTDATFSAYGVEELDRRITGGSTDPTRQERHRRRVQALCSAIKAKGIRLWVVAFATDLTTDLTNCASSGSAFTATDADELNESFRDIANQIAELRLTK